MSQSIHLLDPKCSKTKRALRKLRKKGPLETSSNKEKVDSSSSKEKTAKQSNIHHGGKGFIQVPQEAQYPILNPLYYSHQLLGAPYQPWLPAYGVDFVPTYRTCQRLMSMYPLV
ncbi:Uncharacterized protein Adt_28444 [Abeliophyllum distichum]|uniref:Uncharacterized protein n=1 Tax=Abeliophyllum distichum TaxID=126358 RepID=A0ABD1RWM0_9LAMI